MNYPARRRLLFADDELAQICRDLPESACREQPRNYVLHVLSLSLTRIGEGLAGAKFVFAWLLDAIGAPTSANGLFVPVRESLAMLPQLLISARIRQLSIRWIPLTMPVVAGAVIIGGLAWLAAAYTFASIREEPGATEGSINGLAVVVSQLGLLRSDARLLWIVATRALLLSTALAPPFYAALSGDNEPSGLGTLGPFMVGSAAASLLSSYVWGGSRIARVGGC